VTRQPILTLIGGPTVLIELGGFRVLTDPTFDSPRLYQARGIELEKMEGPAMALEEIGRLDAILLSHDQHLDNLDIAGRAMLRSAPVVITTSSGAARLGGDVRAIEPFETIEIVGEAGRRLHVTGAPARHGPVGIEPISGEVVGFLLGLGTSGDAVYVTGDTVWYEGVAEVSRRFAPKVLIPFAGAARPRGPFRMTMDSNEVIEMAHAFPGALVAPAHNGGWRHFTESRAELAQSFAAVGLADRLIDLAPGVPTTCAV
jgi:L-ascorbate metabolism protein UlaG (beta-lactamase superfamily)